MVGDFKQAIYGFQGTDPERFREAREDVQAPRRAMSTGDDLFSYQQRDAEFRDLSIAASFRSAQPVLDVVDAVIDTRRPRGAGARRAAAAASRASCRPRRARSSCGSRSRSRIRPTTATRARSAGSSLRDRHYAEVLAERIRRMVEEAPVLASTGGR